MNEQETTTAAPPPQSRAELIQQIAKTIKDRRLARALTLEKVMQAIKIRLPYLEAIENGKWDELPAEVFLRGFIRRYAQYLGMDGDKLIAPYIQQSESVKENKTAPTSSPERPGEFGRTQLVWAFLGIIFIIGFLKVIKQDRSTPVKSQAAKTATPAPAASTQTTVFTEKTEPSKPVLAKHIIEVFSPFPLWLRVSASEKNFEGFIPQSSSWTWKGEGEFVVRLGHTKKVVLLFDGKPVLLGEDQKKIVLPSNEN